MKNTLRRLPKLWCFVIVFWLGNTGSIQAQSDGNYKTPPKAIADLVNAPVTPSVSFSRMGDFMLILERSGNPSIEELSQPELRIAGVRINPATNSPSRGITYESIKIKKLKEASEKEISGLPQNPKMSGFSLSKDEKHMVFTNASNTGISLWLVDLTTFQAKKLTDEIVNLANGGAVVWTPDNRILLKAIHPKRGQMPKTPLAPSGPNMQETAGNAAPSRTYQDLLSNPHDEALFEYFMNSQLISLGLDGSQNAVGPSGMIKSMDLSPDGKYIMVDVIKRPFSYLVPASRFPYDVEIWDMGGKKTKTLAQIPLDENRPSGFDATVTGPRSINWRADKPAMLYWVEAQDGGDPKVAMEEREIVFTLDAPFTNEKSKLVSIAYRFSGINWSDDNFALLNERWFSTRQEKISMINPSKPGENKKEIFSHSSDDIYNDPGNPVFTLNQYGKNVLLRNGDEVFMTSEGGSSEGSMPFLSSYNVKTKAQKILWRSQAPYYERVVKVLNENATEFITIKESTDIQPNYWIVNTRKRIAPMQITEFSHPYASIKGISKELVRYKRKDGLDLSAVVYTPSGYDAAKDGRLPVLMWAYPREYKSAEIASQVRGSKYQFTRLNWGSPIYWVTQGYAIMDQTEMPIVGEGADEPNDTFVDQLVGNAEAAIDYIVNSGVGDRDKIAVGGHSYGAFMTANLLSHSQLFAAGIARSGAYNRTLTPFGFQYEQRTYWEAPDVYNTMSPFMNAHKVKTPILLVHGEADNNSGTFPIQSERYYNALKGHGATTRLVFLPHESHGYSAKESILHTLYEQHEWLEKWVKNK
ncbi:glutamyl peptidase [Rhodonellum psychrophilum GCM71 = DSM 17998]|uniref:Glutamyl peptidase n=2 Tax=Rhodonellum TaxID=336827 RepID=U5C050_9BACT|nr:MULTISPECIES: prolyl oligopeptidase family serine peptidase [Rhodonellum]ERM83448.1 glutamyl peptidase [Rhodonellum psychrophilum GCM71 = DSM 17998]SDY44224.1 glutamyl peptidase. Serine peptidase. MEROPS family S09D [Rhodonellum ikkaensis]